MSTDLNDLICFSSCEDEEKFLETFLMLKNNNHEIKDSESDEISESVNLYDFVEYDSRKDQQKTHYEFFKTLCQLEKY